jgi:hypothetical protein
MHCADEGIVYHISNLDNFVVDDEFSENGALNLLI